MTVCQVELGELMGVRNGSIDPSKFPEELFELYSIPSFDTGHPETVYGRNIGSAKQIVLPNDVVLSRIVPHIRRSWVVRPFSGSRQIGSGEWIVFRSERVFPNYLRHILVSDEFNAKLMGTVAGVGGSLLRARPSGVARISIPLPPLAEQQRIAAILDKADELRAKRRAALAKLDTLLQATFLHMFGDPVANPMGWERITFENLLDSIDSGWSPICEDRSVRNGEWGVLKLGAITTCEYKDTKNKALPNTLMPMPKLEVKTGDLLFSRKNTYELVAACALVRKTRSSLMMSDLIFRFNLKENSNLLPEYLWALLTHDGKRKTIQSLAGGAAGSMPNISKEKIRKIKIELPPFDQQQIFACFYNQIQKEKALQSDSLEKLDNLFHALQQRAFKGEL